jgi:hypothetical protein
MKWNRVKNRNDMPKIGQFLALWKGAICMAQYDEKLNQFWIAYFPAETCGLMLVTHEREDKFTHWVYVREPEDY